MFCLLQQSISLSPTYFSPPDFSKDYVLPFQTISLKASLTLEIFALHSQVGPFPVMGIADFHSKIKYKHTAPGSSNVVLISK